MKPTLREIKIADELRPWLLLLAEAAECRSAGKAIWEIAAKYHESNPDQSGAAEDDQRQRPIIIAIDSIDQSKLPKLIPIWIDRFVELLEESQTQQEQRVSAIREKRESPEIDLGMIWAISELERVLQACGERIDPHLEKLVAALATTDRDGSEHLANAISNAGRAITRATPALLDVLRKLGVWCWPSRLTKALARAAKFDSTVVDALRALLSSENTETRQAAMQVLGAIGQPASIATDELLQFRNADENERVTMISALATIGNPSHEILDLFAEALTDPNGYVRRVAAGAIGHLRADSDRFVPLLIAACDDDEPLHDHGVALEAVLALGEYGASARSALPRLQAFISGPVEGRTVEFKHVRKAIQKIDPDIEVGNRDLEPAYRVNPVSEDEPLFAVQYRKRQCYIDRAGLLAIETDFKWGREFSDGLAIVHTDEKTFVINRRGEIAFESPSSRIESFHDGLAAIEIDSKWGFVDRTGKIVIEPKYDSVTSFSEGLAGVETGRGSIDSGVFSVTVPGKQGFIDRSGNIVIPIELMSTSTFREGRAAVCTSAAMKYNEFFEREILSDRRYGYIDRSGKVVIDGKYEIAFHFSEGLAVVGFGLIGKARWGYIDPSGKEMIPLEFTHAEGFKDGLAIVHRRGKKNRDTKFVIDRAGNVVLEARFDRMEKFSEGLAAVSIDGACGFISIAGEIVIPPQFDDCENFQNGLAPVQRGDWFGLIDPTGKFMWGPTVEGSVCRQIKSEWL